MAIEEKTNAEDERRRSEQCRSNPRSIAYALSNSPTDLRCARRTPRDLNVVASVTNLSREIIHRTPPFEASRALRGCAFLRSRANIRTRGRQHRAARLRDA